MGGRQMVNTTCASQRPTATSRSADHDGLALLPGLRESFGSGCSACWGRTFRHQGTPGTLGRVSGKQATEDSSERLVFYKLLLDYVLRESFFFFS